LKTRNLFDPDHGGAGGSGGGDDGRSGGDDRDGGGVEGVAAAKPETARTSI
jgi:hypothetical protein